MPTIQIPNHMHCAICNQAIPYVAPAQASVEEKTCNPEHAAALEELNKKRKRSMMLMYALMALAFVVLIMTNFVGTP